MNFGLQGSFGVEPKLKDVAEIVNKDELLELNSIRVNKRRQKSVGSSVDVVVKLLAKGVDFEVGSQNNDFRECVFPASKSRYD